MSSFPDDRDPDDVSQVSASRTLTLLAIATVCSVVMLLGLVALLKACQPKRSRTVVLSTAISTATLPYYPDVTLPPPAYHPTESRRDPALDSDPILMKDL